MINLLPLPEYRRSYPGFARPVTAPPRLADLSAPLRQAYAVSLRKAASRGVVRGGLTLPLTLRLPRVAPRCRRHSHDVMTDSRSP
jgi:hypothetical protein